MTLTGKLCEWCGEPATTSARIWGTNPGYAHGGEQRAYACGAHRGNLDAATAEAERPPTPDLMSLFDPANYKNHAD